MRVRKKSLGETQAELVAELETAGAELEAAEKSARAELRKIAADHRLGEVDDPTARRRKSAVERALEQKRERVAELEAAIPEIEARAAAEEAERRRVERQTARTALANALKGGHAASRALARSIRDLELQANELGRHRGIVERAREAYAALLERDGEDFSWPDSGPVDEAWEIDDGLLEILRDGPFAPIAQARADAEAAREREQLQDSEKVRWMRAATSPSDARRRLGEVLKGVDPESGRARRIREAGEEHVRVCERGVADARDRLLRRERERAGARA